MGGEDGTRRERLWAAACHLGGLTVFAGIPLGNLLVPGAIWLSWKGASAFVEDQAREALNFQLTVLLRQLLGQLARDVVRNLHRGRPPAVAIVHCTP